MTRNFKVDSLAAIKLDALASSMVRDRRTASPGKAWGTRRLPVTSPIDESHSAIRLTMIPLESA